MKIISWNMEYWSNYRFRDPVSREEWREKCKEYLNNFINSDEMVFLLLQETDPYYFFGIEHEEQFPYRYSKKLSENVSFVYYVEPSSVAKSNPWGNALIFNKAYKDRVCSLEANKSESSCEKNNFMCITFELMDGKKITIINFYNKVNDDKYMMLDVEKNLFEIENDIKEVLNRNNNLVVFAGDFNTGSNNSDLEHIQRYSKLCEKLSGFTDISNGKPELNQNTSFLKGHFYRNDFCFVNKLEYLKLNSIDIENKWIGEENTKKWNGLSDHCPIIVDFNF